MDLNKKFLVCGGDLRQKEVANMISDYGYDVGIYGFDEKAGLRPAVKYYPELGEALEFADIIILPLPCSSDNKTINMPMSKKKLPIAGLFGNIKETQTVVGGNISGGIIEAAKMYDIYIADYYDREELKILNAIPTVEGALQIAMEETATTIHGSKCLITGYGRIGKLLAQTLKSLGALVTVSARQQSDLAWIKAFGYSAVKTDEIKRVVAGQDIIFNTIPATVLDKDILEKVSADCLIIDLASKPGGVDFEAASQLGVKAIWCLSLPGKVAPITAGRIITDTIINLINELGV